MSIGHEIKVDRDTATVFAILACDDKMNYLDLYNALSCVCHHRVNIAGQDKLNGVDNPADPPPSGQVQVMTSRKR